MQVSVVAEALHQLYSPQSTPRLRRRADSLLQRFQRSPEASITALHVLQTPIPVDETDPARVALLKAERVFAASTLYFTVASYTRKYKLEDVVQWTDAERLQHDSITKEFGMLCQQIWDVLTGPNAVLEEQNVRTNLALAIAVILLRFHEQHSESTFVGAVEWLVSNQLRPMVEGAPCDITNFAILLTLKLIPEEVDNKRVKFTKVKRTECDMMVQQAAPHVIQNVLPTIAKTIDASESQSRLRGLLLQCTASWVEHGNVPVSLLLESGLLSRAFRETQTPAFMENAFEVIREVVRACRSDTQVPLMVYVMTEFVQLGRHVRQRVESGAVQEVAFLLKQCATAISECGQAFITYFVEYTVDDASAALVFEFLDTVLFFTSWPDIEISNETMMFWIDFRQYISGKHEQRMLEFERFISRLLNILIERTQIPDGFEATSPVVKEQFGAYRNDVRAVFRSLATVSSASEDRFIVDAIHAVLHQYELADAGHVDASWWRKTEVYIHALSALAKSMREDDLSLVPRVFEYLSRDEPTHGALQRTTTIFLGVASHWFAKNPSFIDAFAFKILSKTLSISEEHANSIFPMREEEDHVGFVALRKLANRCGVHLFKPMWIDSILQLYRMNLVGQRRKGRLIDGSVSLIVESVASIVSRVSYKDATPAVDQLCAIMFEEYITRYGAMNPDDDDSVEFLATILHHLTVLAMQIPPQIDQEAPHPVLMVLQKHWPLMESILRAYGDNEEVMEMFCGVLVGLFENVRFQALDLAGAIMTHLLEQFARTFDSNILKVVKGVIACAGDDEETMTSLTRVFVILVETSLSKIAAGGSVDENPALVVALFDLVSACGSMWPVILVQSNQFEALLALILHALKAQNPEVCASTLDLLKEIGSWYGEVQRIPREQLLTGEFDGKLKLFQLIQALFFEKDVQYHLVVALFQAAGGSMPPTQLDNIAEVLRSCWTYFGRQRSDELMQRLVSDDGFLGTQVPPRTRGEFVSTISRPECTDNSRKFRRVLSAFCDHFRKCLNAPSASAATGMVS